jgi:hypothetical protein
MYSTNISIAGNASITWSRTGATLSDPAYGVVYTGNRWLIGTNNNYLFYSSTNAPNSSYTSSQTVQQYPSAIMSTQGNAVVGGSGNNYNNLYYFNPVTSNTPTTKISANIAPSRTYQIDYISTTTTWIAALYGNTGGNNSIAYSTDLERRNNNPWTNILTVNTNMVNCVGVAASR